MSVVTMKASKKVPAGPSTTSTKKSSSKKKGKVQDVVPTNAHEETVPMNTETTPADPSTTTQTQAPSVDTSGLSKLRDLVPELVDDTSWRAASYLDVPVLKEFQTKEGIAENAEIKAWPGDSKHVNYWVLLVNNRAIGIHEGPKSKQYHIAGAKTLREAGIVA